MPPKLTDINFFSVEKDGVPIKSKKKKNVKERKEKSIHEVSEGSSSDCFDNSEATLKEIFDSYDPGQLGKLILQALKFNLSLYLQLECLAIIVQEIF